MSMDALFCPGLRVAYSGKLIQGVPIYLICKAMATMRLRTGTLVEPIGFAD